MTIHVKTWDTLRMKESCNMKLTYGNIFKTIMFDKIKFFEKFGQHSTSSLSLVQNWVRFKKNLQKLILAFNRVSNLEMHHFLYQTKFDPIFTSSSLFLKCSHCYHIYFHYSYMYNYYNYLERYSLNANFQHFIPRLNKISLLCEPH